MVETVLKSLEIPCFNSSVTVPNEVGCQVMLTGLPAVKPAERVLALRVNALACAETRLARAARTIEVKNCIVTAFYSLEEREGMFDASICLSLRVVDLIDVEQRTSSISLENG